jgi:hypothetical protein
VGRIERDLSRRAAVDHAVGSDLGISCGDVEEAGTVGRDGQREDAVRNARAVDDGFSSENLPSLRVSRASVAIVQIIGRVRFAEGHRVARGPRQHVLGANPRPDRHQRGQQRFGAKRAAQFLEHDRDVEARPAHAARVFIGEGVEQTKLRQRRPARRVVKGRGIGHRVSDFRTRTRPKRPPQRVGQHAAIIAHLEIHRDAQTLGEDVALDLVRPAIDGDLAVVEIARGVIGVPGGGDAQVALQILGREGGGGGPKRAAGQIVDRLPDLRALDLEHGGFGAERAALRRAGEHPQVGDLHRLQLGLDRRDARGEKRVLDQGLAAPPHGPRERFHLFQRLHREPHARDIRPLVARAGIWRSSSPRSPRRRGLTGTRTSVKKTSFTS